MYGVSRNISERKFAEKALRKNEERYRLLFESAPVGIFSATLQGEIIEINPTALQILGSPSAEATKAINLLTFPLLVKTGFSANFKHCIDGGQPVFAEQSYTSKWGKTVYAQYRMTPISDADRQMNLIQVIIEDITERKRAEEATHQRVVELELLYEGGLAFSQLLNPGEIAKKIIYLLEQKMNWHHTAIRLYNSETKTLQLLAYNQPNLSGVEETAIVEEQLKTSVTRLDHGVSGWVVQNGQTVRSNDLTNEARYVETLPGMRSGLYVPIKLGDQAIGVISIESEQANAFSESDERLTNTLASQAASAMENARLFEQTRLHISELTALHHTGQTLLAARLNAEQIFTAVHQAVKNTMPCDAFVIVLDDEERGEYHAVYSFDKGERYPVRWLPRGKGLSGRIISSGEALVIQDAAEVPVNSTHFGASDMSR